MEAVDTADKPLLGVLGPFKQEMYSTSTGLKLCSLFCNTI